MATVVQCRRALDDLAKTLADVSPQLRARHIPDRSVACHLTDLGRTFVCRLDADGVHDLAEATEDVATDVTVTMDSDELVSLARGDDEFLAAWLRGRVQVSAGVRDLLRLRSLLGL